MPPEVRTPTEPIAVEERMLGRYTLRLRLGTGGMGEVHLGQIRGPAGFERWVALKTINEELAEDTQSMTMFLDEARVASRLNHPNLCSVLDFGADSGVYYMVLEYLHGQPLHLVLQRALQHGGMPQLIAARIIADAARGLHAVHELRGPDGTPANVVHRDVTPHNLFVLYDGVAKVVDFGIARFADRLSNRTDTGIMKGKTHYFSPELLEGMPANRKQDLFSLGVVLWECLTGKHLFEGKSQMDVLQAIKRQEPIAPSTVRADVSPALDAIILKAIARSPEQRYQTCAEFARDLDRFIAAQGIPVGTAEVGEFVTDLFQKEREDREAFLRSYNTPAVHTPKVSSKKLPPKAEQKTIAYEGAPPVQERDSQVPTKPRLASPPSVRPPTVVVRPQPPAPAPPAPSPAAPKERSALWLILAAMAVILLPIVAFVIGARTGE